MSNQNTAAVEPVIAVTPSALRRAFLTWGHVHRSGGCETQESSLSKPVEQVADESAAHLWGLLVNPVKVA